VKILITGAAGFLGRHFTRDVLQRYVNAHVTGIDLRSSPFTTYRTDVRKWFADPDNVTYDLVIHLAGVVGGRAKIEGDPLALAVNLELDTAMFRWAVRTKQKHVVYMSSSAVYPTYLQGPLSDVVLRENDVNVEDSTLGMPDQVYGWAKLNGEVLAQRAREHGVVVTVMRPFSGYGGDQDLDYPFPSFIRRAFLRHDPFEVWGDGRQVRDFVHVDDVVGATLAAVDARHDGPLNVCSGIPTSFNDLQRYVCAVAGYHPKVQHLFDAPRGVGYRVGDPGRMLQVYGSLRITLENGIRRALEEAPTRWK
jgi:nucleoside-diphosphate-sugar epimerase